MYGEHNYKRGKKVVGLMRRGKWKKDCTHKGPGHELPNSLVQKGGGGKGRSPENAKGGAKGRTVFEKI